MRSGGLDLLLDEVAPAKMSQEWKYVAEIGDQRSGINDRSLAGKGGYQ